MKVHKHVSLVINLLIKHLNMYKYFILVIF